MTLTAILFVLVALSTTLADEKCPKKKNVKTVAVPLMDAPEDWWYCYNYVAQPKETFCTLELIAESDNIGYFTINYIENENGVNGTKEFVMDMGDNVAGVYNVTGIEGFNATTYIVEKKMLKKKLKNGNKIEMCVSYFKCFSGGEWGGAKDSGVQAGIVCSDKAHCETHGAGMVKNLEKEALSNGEELKKADEKKCKDDKKE